MFRRQDVTDRPFSNRGFMRVAGVIGVVIVVGVFVLAKFGDARPGEAAAQAPATAGPLSAATTSPTVSSQDQADRAEVQARLQGGVAGTGALRDGYGGAVAQLDATAAQLDEHGNPKVGSVFATGQAAVVGGSSPAPVGPAATVAPDGTNLGTAGMHVVGRSTGGVVTSDVPPGASGGTIAVLSNGGAVPLPTTPAQGRLAERAAAERAARTAGLDPSYGGSTQIALASATAGGPPMTPLGAATPDPSAVARAQYIAQVTNATPAPFVRRKPASPFLLREGTHIPLVLDGPINTDHPVIQVAHIPSDVRDSIWKRYVLLPRDTEALVKVDTAGLGASRVTVRIVRFNFPDGTYMDLTDQAGTGPDGEGGFGGQVNDHRGRIFTAALLTAGLSAIPIVAAGGSGTPLTGQTAGQVVAGQVATQIAAAGSQVVQVRVNQPPTIFVPASKIQAMVLDRDIDFTAPYVPQYPTPTGGPS